MIVALTKFEEELSEYVERAILLTPCTVFGTEVDLTKEGMDLATKRLRD